MDEYGLTWFVDSLIKKKNTEVDGLPFGHVVPHLKNSLLTGGPWHRFVRKNQGLSGVSGFEARQEDTRHLNTVFISKPDLWLLVPLVGGG